MMGTKCWVWQRWHHYVRTSDITAPAPSGTLVTGPDVIISWSPGNLHFISLSSLSLLQQSAAKITRWQWIKFSYLHKTAHATLRGTIWWKTFQERDRSSRYIMTRHQAISPESLQRAVDWVICNKLMLLFSPSAGLLTCETRWWRYSRPGL